MGIPVLILGESGSGQVNIPTELRARRNRHLQRSFKTTAIPQKTAHEERGNVCLNNKSSITSKGKNLCH